MALLSLRNLSIAFGQHPLLDGIAFHAEAGERICLTGRNGAGKSTLMKILAGTLTADSGEIVRQPDLRVSLLPQEIPGELDGSIWEVIASGLADKAQLLESYHQLTRHLESAELSTQQRLLEQLDQYQRELESQGAWQFYGEIDRMVSLLQLDGNLAFRELSGGMKRRVLLGRALVSDPHILLLDEPTNHLDISAITWLEDFLLRSSRTIVFITHDRAFLRSLATRIVEIDRGNLRNWDCTFDQYLERREAVLQDELKAQQHFDRKLSEEEQWIRQGIKARRTRNMGRVRALEELRRQRSQRRSAEGKARMEIQQAGRSGNLVAEATGAGWSVDGRTIVAPMDLTIMRGDRIGIIGPNGCGKTTLLRLMLGQLPPTTGRVELGTNLHIRYFDQHRQQLDEEKSVRENVADGNDMLEINGRNRHVIGYLQDFLFTPERFHTPVKALSGGERNRLLLAKLFAAPSNLLIMDEPTNDLDVETLELLEELLMEYQGTLLLVSHDRAFLNNVVTSTIAYEDGRFREYVGGYDDWIRQRPTPAVARTVVPEPTAKTRGTGRPAKPKLSFQQKKELEELPACIEELEQRQQELYDLMADPQFYQREGESIATTKAELEEVQAELERQFARWEKLESLVREMEKSQA
ncbi:ATP-binding cassette domain-containing protein [Desulfurispirillum indicum]|uniref:ATP-binding cassette domain-containing protein n=1 Tax=Desulfurispirillum indicum TaxID=936456 RepID=UPI001CFB83E1|nr:ATP-binding cassette domain-containing protein [Desulfurispirillum indicum]UCZ57844.1 ATP-binding cassette domain-containing protein [Desulfurispirillum indicum]